MAEKRVTKVEYYDMLKKIVENSDSDLKKELSDFIDRESVLVTKRNERQAKYKSAKSKEPDLLYDEVSGLLTEEFQSLDEIMDKIDKEKFPKVSRNKVAARISKLIEVGGIEKKEKSVDGSRMMHYRIVKTAE